MARFASSDGAQGESVFVTGPSRSGTELMRSLLNRHPGIYVAAETHAFADLRPRVRTDLSGPRDRERVGRFFEALQGSAYGLGGAEREDNAPEPQGPAASPDIALQDHCLGEARRVGRDPYRLTLWGEKTPRHVFHGDEILAAFPGARLVVMVRDPRAAVASYRDWRNHWIDRERASDRVRQAVACEERRVRRTYSLTVSALSWRASVAAGEALLARHGPERVRLQRFEALLNEPIREVASLCQFLGIAPHETMTQAPRVNSSYVAANAADALDMTAVDGWRLRLSTKEIWWIERLTGPLMMRHGYRPESSNSHPLFAACELTLAALRLPSALAANWQRQGRPLQAVGARLLALRGLA